MTHSLLLFLLLLIFGHMMRRATMRTDFHETMSMGNRPPAEMVLKDSTGQKIEKLCGQSEWQPRFVSVTADKFLIFHSEEDTDIADQIPLVRKFSRTKCALQIPTVCTTQHEITSSDRTSDGPAEAMIWLINTVEDGYNNGRQVDCWAQLYNCHFVSVTIHD